VLWIQDVYRGSRIRLFSIPDLHKKFKYFNPKKWFPDPDFLPVPDPGSRGQKGTGSRILTFYPSRIPDPGVKKAPDPGYGSATLVNRLAAENKIIKNALQEKCGQLCEGILQRKKTKFL
jgi:hypothetical protein